MTVHDMHLEITTSINASPQDVYALVSDLARMGEWSTENIGGEWISGAPGELGCALFGMADETAVVVQVEVTVADLANALSSSQRPMTDLSCAGHSGFLKGLRVPT